MTKQNFSGILQSSRTGQSKPTDLIWFYSTRRWKLPLFVDIAIPLDDNLETTIAEKKRKYLPLAVELKDIYKLKSTGIVPLVMSTNGLVTKEWSKSMDKLQLHERHCKTMQKAAVLGTANIVRKDLSLD
jgi:hypothetical protein